MTQLPTWLQRHKKTSCNASSYKQPPRQNMGEVSIVGWAGTAEVIRSLINELS